ncbi:uncharacterized protein C19orf44-like isoform X2 [Anneissia japonica]|uniref:uncharacterized protein C19orf44-like isoform X2 n=1 Tax=Anneissia japonica TaxID=1529436 RepID=UPI0014259884|nr:uncharacterized protein C19orf44-like isoform X2 [Anneissia japonica]
MQARRKSASVIEKAQGLLKQSRRLSYVPPVATVKNTEGSELDAYLSQLSLKTSGTPIKKTKSVIDGLSDLSLTTDDEDINPEQRVVQSRFVKKSLSQTLTKPVSSVEGLVADSTKRRPVSASGKLNRTAPSYSSSALNKAAAFTAKYASKKKSAQIVTSDDSDINEDIIAEITNKKLNVKSDSSTKFKGAKTEADKIKGLQSLTTVGQPEKFSKSKHYVSNMHSLSPKRDASSDERKEELNTPKSKFLKKSAQTAGKSVDKKNWSSHLKKTVTNKVQTSTPKKIEKTPPLESLKTFDDSDDEMQAFIINLSPVTSPDIPPIKTQQTSARSAHTSKKVKENVEEPKESEDIDNDLSTDSSIPEEDNKSLVGFHSHVLQMTDLQEVISEVSNTEKKFAKQNAPEKNQRGLTSRSSISSFRTIGGDSDEDIVEEVQTERSISGIRRFGLQTINDLRDTASTKSESYASDFESDSEILTENATSEKQSAQICETIVEQSYSHSFEKSSSSIKKKKRSVRDSYSTSFSTQTPRNESPHSKHKGKGQRSFSYTEDFDSDSRKTDSEVEDLPRDASRTETFSQSYTSETRTLTITPRTAKRRSRVPGIDVGTQVDAGGLQYQWNPNEGVAVLGPSLGLGYTDPTPVASHVISPDALEALTGYSPSVLAMNNMLRAQLIATQSAIQNMNRLHHQLMNSISEDYQYTTLEETRQYINKHRQPRLTMEEALKQVKGEMDDGYR